MSKDFIKKLLKEGLIDEVKTVEKPVFGKGVEHKLYASKNNPNILYKVGKKDTVLTWVELFKSNPKLFPAVSNAKPTQNGYYYAGVEKLDTKKAENDWFKMEQALELTGFVDTDVYSESIEQLFIKILSGEQELAPVFQALNSNRKIQLLFKKWIIFLDKTVNFVENFGYKGLDIHRYNFAYDKTGNIKAIDV